MKNALIFFLVGAIAGAVALHLYQRSEGRAAASSPRTAPPAPAVRSNAAPAPSALNQKLTEWRLTPDDIKHDLAKTGQVVRTKAAEVGARISDARIVAVIKAKYILDSDLSALAIDVDCRNGQVTLKGTVKSPYLIGRAVALALDTEGVKNVVSRLKVSG